jgi:tetratricopeptide (TPR) repeat protein
LLSRKIDRPVEDFFDIRDEITELIVANVRIALPAATQHLPVADYEAADLSSYVLYRRGKEIFEQPHTMESLGKVFEYYKQALAIDPQYAAAHAGICDMLVAKYKLSNDRGDIASAERACAAALELNPRLYMVHTALGELNLRQNKTAAAEDAFDVALSIHPHDVQAMIGLSSVQARLDRHHEAEQILRTAVATRPGNWLTINALGSFFFERGRYLEAADAFRQLVLLDPDNVQVRTNLGSALTMGGDFEAGKRVFEESLEIEEFRTAYANLGVIYYYLGEFDKSVDALRKAIELSPNEANKWLSLADALYFSGQDDEATGAFRKAAELAESRISVDRADIVNVHALAWAQLMLGESQTAKATVARGMELAPDDPYSHYYDALIKVAENERDSAITSLRTAVDYGYPVKMLAAEPYLQGLREDPNFLALISGDR